MSCAFDVLYSLICSSQPKVQTIFGNAPSTGLGSDKQMMFISFSPDSNFNTECTTDLPYYLVA